MWPSRACTERIALPLVAGTCEVETPVWLAGYTSALVSRPDPGRDSCITPTVDPVVR